MNKNLMYECLRELLLDPQGTNMPKRKLLAELIDVEVCPKDKEEKSCGIREEDTTCECGHLESSHWDRWYNPQGCKDCDCKKFALEEKSE